jgi:hypothetical protein
MLPMDSIDLMILPTLAVVPSYSEQMIACSASSTKLEIIEHPFP